MTPTGGSFRTPCALGYGSHQRTWPAGGRTGRASSGINRRSRSLQTRLRLRSSWTLPYCTLLLHRVLGDRLRQTSRYSGLQQANLSLQRFHFLPILPFRRGPLSMVRTLQPPSWKVSISPGLRLAFSPAGRAASLRPTYRILAVAG